MKRRFGSSLKIRIAAVSVLLFLAGISLIIFFVTRILHDDMQDVLSKQQLTTTSYIARDIDAKVTLRLESLKRVALNTHRRCSGGWKTARPFTRFSPLV